ncbi:MAG: SGNH/GDSL hydrolase family protein [Planctomycetaceae bacterium]|nr:SGNH/GDSL hydrolase family protein [Planctomycetaceae bacterium]
MPVLTGWPLAAISSTPLPIWFWVMATAGVFIAILPVPVKSDWPNQPPVNNTAAQTSPETRSAGTPPVGLPCSRQRRIFGQSVVMLWLSGAVFEATWLPVLRIDGVESDAGSTVVVLADSVTAGMGEGEAVTWPRMLRDRYGLRVEDLSHVGETVGSSLKRLLQADVSEGAVFLIELGGNDLLGSTTADRFSDGLDALLAEVQRCNPRAVVMFELPLPPLCNRWGRIQRQMAVKHHVLLIPKRKLASVFAGNSSTIDSIHLTQEGHNRMLQIVTDVL